MKPLVSIIIPTWNGLGHLEGCLPSLFAQDYSEFEVVVVDNGSTDGSQQFVRTHFPQVKMIELDKNYGFARPTNIGIRATTAPYVATLNNDTMVDRSWLAELVRAIQSDPGLGMVACKMLYADDPQVINSAGIDVDLSGFARNRCNFHPDDAAHSEPCEVFGACAGAALYRREMLDEIGLFDEDYFAYLEDVDLAWRARLAGWRCLYVPAARVLHVHSATSEHGSRFKRFHIDRNRLWTLWKNYPSPAFWWRLPMLLWYDLLSLLFWMGVERNFSPLHGRLAALGKLRSMLRKRRAIQRQRRTGWPELRRLMLASPGLKVGIGKFMQESRRRLGGKAVASRSRATAAD